MRPLRPATDHRLGEPLPHQLANQPRPPLPAPFGFDLAMLCGISPGFPGLSPARRQVSHVLLTRSPLYSRSCPRFLVRLACVRHAASVDSEPGSNSRLKPDVSPGWRDCHSDRSRNDYLVSTLGLEPEPIPSHDWHVQPICQRPNHLSPERGEFSPDQKRTNARLFCPRNLKKLHVPSLACQPVVPTEFPPVLHSGELNIVCTPGLASLVRWARRPSLR